MTRFQTTVFVSGLALVLALSLSPAAAAAAVLNANFGSDTIGLPPTVVASPPAYPTTVTTPDAYGYADPSGNSYNGNTYTGSGAISDLVGSAAGMSKAVIMSNSCASKFSQLRLVCKLGGFCFQHTVGRYHPDLV